MDELIEGLAINSLVVIADSFLCYNVNMLQVLP